MSISSMFDCQECFTDASFVRAAGRVWRRRQSFKPRRSSIAHIPGARVLRKGDFVGVVADREWDAVRAAQQLKITWDVPATLPGSDGVYDAMRAGKTTDRVVLQKGDVESAVAGAAHVASGSYHAPYQAHAPFGPNGALADVTPDSALVICSTQDVYATRNALAGVLGVPSTKVRVQYYEGSGTYGHSCYDDAAQAAAILSQLAGKPVRLQDTRWDGMAGTSTAKRTSVKYVPQPMRTAKSSPISTTAGITIGAPSKPPRSSRSEPPPRRGGSAPPSK